MQNMIGQPVGWWDVFNTCLAKALDARKVRTLPVNFATVQRPQIGRRAPAPKDGTVPLGTIGGWEARDPPLEQDR